METFFMIIANAKNEKDFGENHPRAMFGVEDEFSERIEKGKFVYTFETLEKATNEAILMNKRGGSKFYIMQAVKIVE